VELVDRVRADLRAVADPSRAAGQRVYMKSAMPFLGVRVPEARRIARSAAKGESDADVLRRASRALWDDAQHREERYAAQALVALRPLRGDLSNIPLIEHMVRTGQWWDFVDELTGRVAELHDRHPKETADLARRWSRDPDVWMRRLAILSQLRRRDRTDFRLLDDVIAPNATEREFFIRKAIGWALRDAARTDPDWVRRCVDRHGLSSLSRREALKHL